MIRVAVIGYSGAGRSTLANALAGVYLTRPISGLPDLWEPLASTGPVVLDGFPRTVAELEQIDRASPADRPIAHFLYLQAPAEARLARIARTIVSGAEPAGARDRMLHPADLENLRRRLDPTGRLSVIDASRVRSDVLQDALAILGIKV